MLSARLLLQLSFTRFGLTEVLELMVRKVKSDIESVKVVMQEVRYKLSLCSNIRTPLQNRMYHNLWNITFSVSSS